MLRNGLNLLLLLILLLTPVPVMAQSELKIEHLQIDIWPEYDRPDVLIIYHITLPEETNLPVQMSLRIPLSAAETLIVAMKDVDGLLYNLNYTTVIEDEWTRVSFIALSNQLQLEYYDQNLHQDGDNRSFEYRWPGDYNVNSLVVSVQQPTYARQIQFVPDMGSGRPGLDNLIYYTLLVGASSVHKEFSLSLSYENPDNLLSADIQQSVQPVQPIPDHSEGNTISQGMLFWGFGVFGVLLIVGGSYLFWKSGRKNVVSSASQRRPASARVKEPSHESDTEMSIYCHQCGKPAMSGDVFCRVCGTKLRND